MLRVLLLSLGIILLQLNFSNAAPIIQSVSGQFDHNSTVTISGSSFGIKSPAPPKVWDNCENDTHGGSIALNSPSAVRSFYNTIEMVWPATGVPDNYELNYRSHPFTNPYSGARPISGPHSMSNNYLAAGAYGPASGNLARNIAIGYYRGSTGSNAWYASWYIRHDNNTWPRGCGGDGCNNIKVYAFQDGADYLGGGAQTYVACNGGGCYADYSDTECVSLNTFPCGGAFDNDCDTPAKSEMFRWMHSEIIFRQNPGKLLDTRYDNINPPIKMHDKSCNSGVGFLSFYPRAFFVGGFNRWWDSPDGYTHSGIWRYFDDIYIDDTLSRVVLANNSNYNNATKIEPQIPSAWNSGSINVKVNLGAITGNTAYLFVFDADNNRNATGYPVSIGGGVATTTTTSIADNISPDPPTGLRIVTTTIP